MMLPVVTFAAQAPNPRSAGATPRSESRVVDVTQSHDGAQASRAAVNRRTVGTTVSRAGTTMPTTVGAVTSRSAARQIVSPVASNRGGTEVTVSRSARTPATTSSSVARSAKTPTSARAAAISTVNTSRAATSRATAIYDDVSKMGTGYAACREAYNTCMDQFCAKSNDTFRRCYCSSRYTDFIDTENALDEAKTLLMRFQDNNLNAIDKTAAEVNAMYTATIGEQAIKNDPSAAQQTLSQIGDLLSGKKKTNTKTVTSLTGLTIDFSADLDDIWGDNGSSSSSSLFGFNTAKDMTALEGLALYNEAHKQCMDLVKDSCENNAVTQMVKSSYGILITQDCNAYEKNVNTKKQAVENTVREAEKILREARLEEYRAHNSPDVNECISKVKTAILNDNACGANYKKCLDYTGQYIDVNTGEPIYSAHLQDLTKLINLQASSTSGDVVGQNAQFSNFLDQKKMYAEMALDSCRDKADVVWNDFKRSAMIEIAQAQNAKIEEVKDSCVDTMAQCYDKQSGALADLDTTLSQATGALNAYTTRAFCVEKVAACAAVYAQPGDPECQFDSNGRLTTPNCGLQALVNFVEVVDNYKVAEGCEESLRNFVETTCAPANGDKHEAPWGCRLRAKGVNDNYVTGGPANSINAMLQQFAINNCTDPSVPKPASYNEWTDTTIKNMVDTTLRKILEDIDYVMYDECNDAEGLWITADEVSSTDKAEQAFYVSAYAGRTPDLATKAPNNDAGTSWGYCVQNTVRYQCIAQDEATGKQGYAKFDQTRNTCTFTDEWYQIKCEGMGGYFEGGVCYV